MKKKGLEMIIIGLLLIAAALAIVGYNIWDDNRAAKMSEDALQKILPDILNNDEPSDKPLTGDMPVKIVDGVGYIGVISIPSLGIDLPVNGEWSYPALKNSPCRYVGSAYTDDMVICAHNYNWHFGQLKTLNYGDTVMFADVNGNVFTYEVAEIETLRPTAVEDMTIGDEWDLTLFTCTIGGATRVTVRCVRTSNNF